MSVYLSVPNLLYEDNIPMTVTIHGYLSYLDNHPWMVTIPRIVKIPRMVTNSTDQTRALQLLFGYRSSSFQ